MLHGIKHGLLGDGVKDHALHFHVFERAFFLENFKHVPGNGFAFAVRVGCQNKTVISLEGVSNVCEALGRLAIDLP